MRNKCFAWELGKGYQGSYILLSSGLSLIVFWTSTDYCHGQPQIFFLFHACLGKQKENLQMNMRASHSEHIWTVNISLHIVYMPGIIFYQLYYVQQVFLLTKFWMLMYIWVHNENNLIVLPNFWTAPNTLISKLIIFQYGKLNILSQKVKTDLQTSNSPGHSMFRDLGRISIIRSNPSSP